MLKQLMTQNSESHSKLYTRLKFVHAICTIELSYDLDLPDIPT